MYRRFPGELFRIVEITVYMYIYMFFLRVMQSVAVALARLADVREDRDVAVLSERCYV